MDFLLGVAGAEAILFCERKVSAWEEAARRGPTADAAARDNDAWNFTVPEYSFGFCLPAGW